MIVLDSSAAIAALLHARTARAVVGSERLHAPHLVDAEIANSLRRAVIRGDLSAAMGWRALAVWRRVGVTRYPMLTSLGRIWELRENLSAYDAAYVALAERLGCALITADARLSRAPGIRCAITVVPG